MYSGHFEDPVVEVFDASYVYARQPGYDVYNRFQTGWNENIFLEILM